MNFQFMQGKHRTLNIEHRTLNQPAIPDLFDVQRSMFSVRCLSLYSSPEVQP